MTSRASHPTTTTCCSNQQQLLYPESPEPDTQSSKKDFSRISIQKFTEKKENTDDTFFSQQNYSLLVLFFWGRSIQTNCISHDPIT